MAEPIQVFILTHCRNGELLYGTTLTFETLRVGFPNARVTVVDNASLPETRGEIERRARECDCEFRQLEEPAIAHDAFLAQTLASVARQGGGPLVFLDPDLCLWRSCEDLEFDALMAGKLVLAHEDAGMQCVVLPRLHTAFLWIPEARRLQQEVDRLRNFHFDFRPFQPFSVKLGDAWIRYDTGASLFAAISDRVRAFDVEEQERYDHIYCGTHRDVLETRWNAELRELMLRVHAAARDGDLESLRGIWREQDRVFRRASPSPFRDEVG